jgi:hypothetical protein
MHGVGSLALSNAISLNNVTAILEPTAGGTT